MVEKVWWKKLRWKRWRWKKCGGKGGDGYYESESWGFGEVERGGKLVKVLMFELGEFYCFFA